MSRVSGWSSLQAKGKQNEMTDEDVDFKKKQAADKKALEAAAKVRGGGSQTHFAIRRF